MHENTRLFVALLFVVMFRIACRTPKNESALSMRARVEDYASRGLGWTWN